MAEERRKTMTGRVMSDKMDKTVVVMVQSTTKHRLYKKVMRRSKRYLAHDEGTAKPGDTVRIEETRPYSRHKRWRVAEILRRGEVAEVAPREIDSAYLSMPRQVETPTPPPPRGEDKEQDAVGVLEAEEGEAVEGEDPEPAAEQPEASTAVDAAATEDATDDETPEAPGVDSESASEVSSVEPASEEEKPAEDEDDKA